jgi:mannose-1-phosphate guanylyltransferase
LAAHLPRDADNNAIRGKAVLHDAKNNLIVSDKRHIALCGVENLVVVETADTVLVCHKDRAQEIKQLLPRIPEKLL